MEIIISILGWGLSLLLSNNLVMSAVKYLSQNQSSKTWLRTALIVISILGIVAASSISGEPINFNQLSDLGKLLLETIVLSIGSHYSYTAIKQS